ncbi:MAG: anti-sigma factor [Defluviitaleaceae bacterium]|nr:anti-sigma factor [Defluviitaleaceae bacterium]
MACEKYTDMMMDYMDGNLSDVEQNELKQHMEECNACNEDFAAYSEILQGFNELEIIEAPEDFAASVMAKIYELNLYAPKKASVKERLVDGAIFAAWVSVATVLFGGIGFAIFGNGAVHFAQIQGFYTLSNIFEAITVASQSIIAAIGSFLASIGNWSESSMVVYSIAFFALFAALLLLQVYIIPRQKAAVERNRVSE